MEPREGALSEASGLEHDCCPFGDACHLSSLAFLQYSLAVDCSSRECRALESNCSSTVQWLQNCSLWMICSAAIKATGEHGLDVLGSGT